jgi:hypothetical protein
MCHFRTLHQDDLPPRDEKKWSRKTRAAFLVIGFFHSETCTGRMSNSLAISWMVSMLLISSSTT